MNWEQLKTILWLRQRLTRNQLSRGVAGQILTILLLVFGIFAALGAFVGGLLGGSIGLAKSSPNVVMAIWLAVTVAFLFFWMIGLLTELQRTEMIDLQRLMHLPVRLGQVFVINFVASHVVTSIIITLPGMIGLTIGLTIARGPLMLLLIPLALAMIFMISAWTYCLRGWLAALMTNPRKRRSIIMGITFCFVIVFQLPNLMRFSFSSGDGKPAHGTKARRESTQQFMGTLRTLADVQQYIPPLWLPVGARALAEGSALPALAGTLGCFALGALGLRRAYRTTVRFYHGDTNAKSPTAAPVAEAAAMPGKIMHPTFLEHRIPGVPDEAAAVATATLQSMWRAPEVKMAWAMSFIVALILGGGIFMRGSVPMPETAKPFIATGVICFAIFMLFQFLSNQFGYDREGFRSLVLSPMDRRHILLGKNLATAPVAVASALVLLGIATYGMKLGISVVVAALFQLVAVLVLASLAGNLISILVPFRMQAGAMKAAKMPPLALFMLIGFNLLAPIFFSPVFIPPTIAWLWHRLEMPAALPVNLILSATLALLALTIYVLTLAPMGRLLMRREIKILATVTSPVE